jgi:hypothetical protein
VRAASDADGRTVSAILDEHDRRVTAALADVTRADWGDFPGTWVGELDNFVRRGMPTADAFEVRPTDRWPVYQHQLNTPPVPAKQTAEKAEIASTAVEQTWVTVNDATYAHGNDVSVQVLDDNGEQALTDLVEVTGEYVGRLINADAIGAIEAGLTNAALTGGATLANFGAAVGAAVATGRPGPIVAACAPDVYGKLWELTASGGPSLDRLTGADDRLRIIPDASIATGVSYVGPSSAFRTYLSRRATLRAVEVSLLGINVGVYRRAAFRVVDAAAITKIGA